MSKIQERVVIEVSGSLYTAKIEHFCQYPTTRLGKLFLNKPNLGSFTNDELSYDRPAVAFEAILSYYQTGELHIPLHMCPKAFKKELEFWQIDPANLDNCCLHKYLACLSECETISAFQAYVCDQPLACQREPWKRRHGRLRDRIWSVVANKEKSKMAKLFLFVSVLMVATSLVSLILGTMPKFQTPITSCDMVKLAREMGIEDDDTYRILASLDCDSDPVDKLKEVIYKKGGGRKYRSQSGDNTESGESTDNEEQTTSGMEANMSESSQPGKDRNNETVKQEAPTETKQSGEIEKSKSGPTAQYEYEGEYWFYNEHDLFDLNDQNITYLLQALHKIKALYVKKPLFVLFVLDDITVAFFTLELILRLVSCPSFKKYFKSIINIIDIVILLAAYVTYIASEMTVKAEYDKKGIIRIFQYIQMFRVLRILRITQNIAAVRVLGYSMRSSIKDMLVLFIYLFIGVLIFSSFLYFVENSEMIKSIPDACWWSVITMTTVGYGDIVPNSGIGRFVGSLCAISGVILLSMVIPVFVNTFMSVYQFAKLNEQMNKTCSNSKQALPKNKNDRKEKFGPIYQVTPIQ